jgi:orotidine-5'-phosphate decarboxylase
MQKSTLAFADLFKTKYTFVKIGMELSISMDRLSFGRLKARGHKIFLDLKLHDISNTYVRYAKSFKTGPDIIDVHAAGTTEMMKLQWKGLFETDGSKPL